MFILFAQINILYKNSHKSTDIFRILGIHAGFLENIFAKSTKISKKANFNKKSELTSPQKRLYELPGIQNLKEVLQRLLLFGISFVFLRRYIKIK